MMSPSWLLLAVVGAIIGAPDLAAAQDSDWWKTASIYQIYPRSFQDSDGDGIGDLPGITSRLEHLQKLAVDAIWISPFFNSPQVDFGYDISNFIDVDPVYGTLDDFDALVARAKELGIKVILDFVPNHTSDEHDWFARSIAGEEGYKDYFIWRDPLGIDVDNNPIPPNDWIGSFDEVVWTFNEQRGQFYFHIFTAKQPDLNYWNPQVRQEMEDVLTFWLNRGVDGYRVDSIANLVEDPAYPNVPTDDMYSYTSNQPLTYTICTEWRSLLDEYSQVDGSTRVLITESFGSTEQIMAYYGNETHPGAHFPFNFLFITNLNSESKAINVVDTIYTWLGQMPPDATPNWVIGNHDNYRVASRYNADVSIGMAMITLLLPGATLIYYGDEIGMVNNFDISYEDTQDPLGCNAGPDGYLARSRDFERTPFQWNNSTQAGFSTAVKTWLPVNSNYLQLNHELQATSEQPHSFYNIYKDLVELKKYSSAIISGTFEAKPVTENVFLYLRGHATATSILVVVNLGGDHEIVSLSSIFPIIPQDLYVYTSNLVSDLQFNDVVTSNEVHLNGYAAAVLGDRQFPVSGANWNQSMFAIFFSALLVTAICSKFLSD